MDEGVQLAALALEAAQKNLEGAQCPLAEGAARALVTILNAFGRLKNVMGGRVSRGKALLKDCVNPLRDVLVWRVMATVDPHDREGFLAALRRAFRTRSAAKKVRA